MMNNVRYKTNKTIFYLEGLPGCGKTTTLNNLSDIYFSVPEIAIPEDVSIFHNGSDQTYFLRNDETKYDIANLNDKISIVDRSPLSTLFFNLAKQKLSSNHKMKPILDWFEMKVKPNITNKHCKFILMDISPELSLKRKNRQINKADPWANPQSLSEIREMFLDWSRKNKKQFTVIDGSLNYDLILDLVHNELKKYE